MWRGSVKPMAARLLPKLNPDDEIVIFRTYRQDLPIYLHRNVTVVEYTGELAFGEQIEPETQAWMISADEFSKRCHDRRLYVLMDKAGYDRLQAPEGCALKPFDVGAPAPERFILLTNGHD
jgi:Aminoarabinose transferase C-terminal domain